jgi:hypothetical protein
MSEMKLSWLSTSLSLIICLLACNEEVKYQQHLPAGRQTATIANWENLRFGAFVHFNDNTFMGKEISQNDDPKN